jgi:uncharacterized membrane protein
LPIPAWRRFVVFAVIASYVVLAIAAWSRESAVLSALCVVLLVTAVLARGLAAGKAWAWASWIALCAGVLALTLNGQGRLALDLVPVAINLALACLFGWSLRDGHMPLIARAIQAIEGPERLAMPRVAGYARALTAAWTGLFIVQVVVFSVLLAWWLPMVAGHARLHSWGMTYLHVGGFLLPAVFMALEFGFRHWYLRHIPHDSLPVFMKRLMNSWPGLLRGSTSHDRREH